MARVNYNKAIGWRDYTARVARGKAVRGIKKQPRKNASIPREGYIAALDLANEMLAGHHKLKAMELEEEPGHFTKFEAIARTVTSILRRNDKGRVVIEYDPADDRVKFYELFPETETEQPGGNSMTEESGTLESR